MGIHSGPVSGVIDVTGRANLAGVGLNMANRVMSCGDAGHILVSKRIAEDLGEYEHWRPFLHDLGACEVKHGVRIGVVSLYNNGVGNPQLPKKFQALKQRRTRVRWAEATIPHCSCSARLWQHSFSFRADRCDRRWLLPRKVSPCCRSKI